MHDPKTHDARRAVRRRELIAELSPVLHANHPTATKQDLLERVGEEVDMRLTYERFGQEP